MIGKHPVPSPDELPACFGDRYDAEDARCRRCPAKSECARHTGVWGNSRSLSERVAELARTLTGDEPESIEALYTRLHRENFGRKPFLAHAAALDTLSRVAQTCRDEGLDVETFIAGNMWAMAAWVKANPRVGFRPTHLSGDGALRRYHAYLGRLSRRLRHAKHDALSGETTAAHLRRALLLGEYAVAEEFVARYVEHGKATWQQAIEDAEPRPEWLALERRTGDAYARACNLFGSAEKLKREREFARLRAGASLAERYQHGLADRIGLRVWDWTAFAALVRRLVGPAKPRVQADLAEVPGVAWR